MNLGELLSPQAGQDRRAWLNSLDERIDETLGYYLGPMMPQVRAATSAATEFTDVADYRDAVVGADQMFNAPGGWDKAAGAGLMTSAIAAALVPGVSRRVAEGVTDAGVDMARFLADEDGGIRVWHGSPHDFDKFSLDKIGTGEGAQAYGHGLYFAESPDVARAYRDTITKIQARHDSPMKAALSEVFQSSDLIDPQEIDISFIRGVAESVADSDPDLAAQIARLSPQDARAVMGGRLYEVDLHANPEDFLDWDAPLSEGMLWDIGGGISGSMDRAEEELSDFFRYSALPGDMTGREAYMWLGNTFGKDEMPDGVFSLPERAGAEYAARALKEAGIPGIRYLDQGSRGAGDGTRNYVVFDENIIEIVKKFGIAGAAAMLGMSAGELEAQVARQPVAIGDWLRGSDEEATATLQEYLR